MDIDGLGFSKFSLDPEGFGEIWGSASFHVCNCCLKDAVQLFSLLAYDGYALWSKRLLDDFQISPFKVVKHALWELKRGRQ